MTKHHPSRGAATRCTWRIPCIPPAVTQTCTRRAADGSDRCREHEYRPNHLPGWRPAWERERDEARAQLAATPGDRYWTMRLAGAEHALRGGVR